jgi:methionyl-tRNA formyltransferase
MKYVFFGTPRFAEIVLKGLIDADMLPVAVVCNPDRPVGRKKVVTPPPTKMLAISASSDIDIIQPEKIDENFINRLRALEPDFFVVAAYANILPQAVLDIPRLGALGVHPSLLPRYRGASPIQSVILAGEPMTGVTIYIMDEKTDHGGILARETLTEEDIKSHPLLITGLSYLDLEEKLAQLGAQLLIKKIPAFIAGALQPKPQDESQATFTKKFTTQDGFVDEKDLAAAMSGGDAVMTKKIIQKIHALNPEPGVWTMHDGKRLKLLDAELRDGKLQLLETQLEGKKTKRVG